MAHELVVAGSDMAGSAAAGALTLLGTQGLIAAAAGGPAVALVFRRVGASIRRRRLEARQELRSGAAFAIAANRVGAQILSGEEIRRDAFFEGEKPYRSRAEELLEGTLRVAADSFEEHKVPYVANLYAALPFRADISGPYANFLLRLADRLTWRQLVCLAYLQEGTTDLVRREIDLIERGHEKAEQEPTSAIVAETDELSSLRLAGFKQKDGRVIDPSRAWGEDGDKPDVKSPQYTRTRTGDDLASLMGLDEMPPAALDPVIDTLARAKT